MMSIRWPAPANRHAAAFTAVEVLVAITFAAVIILSVSFIYTTVNQINAGSQHLLAAGEAAKSRLSLYQGMPYSDIPAGTEGSPATIDFTSELPTSLPAPKSGVVYVVEKKQNLKSIKVVVTFMGTDGMRKIEHAALITDQSSSP